MKICTITSLFRKLQYEFYLNVLSYYKSFKQNRTKKQVNTTRLRVVVIDLFLSTRSLTLTYCAACFLAAKGNQNVFIKCRHIYM